MRALVIKNSCRPLDVHSHTPCTPCSARSSRPVQPGRSYTAESNLPPSPPPPSAPRTAPPTLNPVAVAYFESSLLLRRVVLHLVELVQLGGFVAQMALQHLAGEEGRLGDRSGCGHLRKIAQVFGPFEFETRVVCGLHVFGLKGGYQIGAVLGQRRPFVQFRGITGLNETALS